MLPPAYYYFMVLVVRSALLYHTRESGGVPRDSAKSDAMKPVCLVYIVFVLCGCMYLSPTVWPIPQSRKNGLHSYSAFCNQWQYYNYNTKTKILPNIYPFVQSFTHRLRRQPWKSKTSLSGAVRVRCLLS